MKTVHERNMISSFSSIFTSLGLNVKIVVTRLSKRNFGERKKKKSWNDSRYARLKKKKKNLGTTHVTQDWKKKIRLSVNKSKQRGKRRCNFYNDSSRRRFRRKYRTNRELERNRVGRLTFLKTVRAIRATSPKLVPSEPIALKFSRISSR